MFQLRGSRYFFIIVSLIYIGGFFCLWVAAIYPGIKILITIVLTAHFIFLMRKYFLRVSSKAILAFHFDGEHWHLKMKSGEMCVVKLADEIVLTRYFILLNFLSIVESASYRLFLFPDSICPNDFRRLRTMLALEL